MFWKLLGAVMQARMGCRVQKEEISIENRELILAEYYVNIWDEKK